MPHVDKRSGELVIRIVYDGAPEAGKTTNIAKLTHMIALQRRGAAESPGTAGARTQFFDWLDFSGGFIDGRRVRCQLVSVPGQPELLHRRRYLLKAADAVVYVADARRQQVAPSAKNLGTTMRILAALDAKVPVGVVVQANKQDMDDVLDAQALAASLDLARSVAVIPSVALEGSGVMETFILATRLATDRVRTMLYEEELPGLMLHHESPDALFQEMLSLESSFQESLEEVAREAEAMAKEAQAARAVPPVDAPSTEDAFEARARREAEDRARQESLERAKREAEDRARQESLERAKREAEDRARQESLERAKREAEDRARQESLERAKREAEDRARQESLERARREAEERAKREAEKRAKREAEERAKREAEERVKREAEERVRREAEETRVRAEAEAEARKLGPGKPAPPGTCPPRKNICPPEVIHGLGPGLDVSAGHVWPPVKGRAILASAALDKLVLEAPPHVVPWAPENALELTTREGWRFHSSSDWLYDEEPFARVQLVSFVRRLMEWGEHLPQHRAVFLLPEGKRWRLWALTGPIPSLSEHVLALREKRDLFTLQQLRARASEATSAGRLPQTLHSDELGLESERLVVLRLRDGAPMPPSEPSFMDVLEQAARKPRPAEGPGLEPGAGGGRTP